MKTTDNLISDAELKSLLTTIIDYKINVNIRYRLLGEMWQQNFMRVVILTGKGVLLHDEIKHKLVSIEYLSDIVQFELDGSFHTFQPNFHYSLVRQADQLQETHA